MYLSLGSNIDDRLGNLQCGVAGLGEISQYEIKKSSVYETEAWGRKDQPDFLNCVLKLTTRITPENLLREIKMIEKQCGREESSQIWGPRLLDIDVLLFDDLVIKSRKMTIPHSQLECRRFVLEPLSELAPELHIPGIDKSVRHLLENCNDKSDVRKLTNEEMPGWQ